AQLNGAARLRGGTQITGDLTVPALAPFAALEKVDMQGSAAFHVALNQNGSRSQIALSGRMDTHGTALLARMLGSKATLAMHVTLDGSDLAQSQVQVEGA